MSGEGYEGWANRETWCLNLWLANDEGSYNMVRDWARGSIGVAEPEYEWQTIESVAVYQLADILKDWYDEFVSDVLEGSGSDENATMVRDVGSEWRIDWHEIAQQWVTDELTEINAS